MICANLAVEVRRRTHKKVLLVDLDLQFGDLALLLNVAPRSTLAHIAESAPAQMDANFIETHIPDSAFGVRVLAAPLRPEYAKVVTAETVQKVMDIAINQYDYIFVDTVPSFDSVVLAALDRSDGIILIVAPDFLTLKNVTLGMAVMDTLAYPKDKVHLVLNRAQSLSSIRIKDIERGLQRRVEVEIPSDGELVVSSVNRGQPLVLSHPQSPVSKAICQIADLLVPRVRWSRKKKSRNSRRAFLGRYWGRDNRVRPVLIPRVSKRKSGKSLAKRCIKKAKVKRPPVCGTLNR